MKKESCKKLILVSVFAIAMAFLEAVFVIYLRKLYYPAGFGFPLTFPIEKFIYSLEILREVATIIMLVGIGILVGKKAYEKFAYFIYCFAIWDIFYYVFLKLALNWPSSILTWDSLFLIPIQWVGPVLAPIICSVTMIIFAICIINFQDKGSKIKIKLKEWILLIFGSLIITYTFLCDYGKLMMKGGFFADIWHLDSNLSFQQAILAYAPSNYNWLLFILGLGLIIFAIALFYRRYKK